MQQYIPLDIRLIDNLGLYGLQTDHRPNSRTGFRHPQRMQQFQRPAHCDNGYLILLCHLRKRWQITANWIVFPENLTDYSGGQGIPHLGPTAIYNPGKRNLIDIPKLAVLRY